VHAQGRHDFHPPASNVNRSNLRLHGGDNGRACNDPADHVLRPCTADSVIFARDQIHLWPSDGPTDRSAGPTAIRKPGTPHSFVFQLQPSKIIGTGGIIRRAGWVPAETTTPSASFRSPAGHRGIFDYEPMILDWALTIVIHSP